jgi:hypothetical protein
MNKKQLSGPQQWLIKQCQRVNFGRVTFRVRSREADLGHPRRTLRTVKLTGGENGPRPEAGSADFELRSEHVALLSHLARLSDGVRVVKGR